MTDLLLRQRRSFLRRYLEDPAKLLDDIRVVGRGMSATVDVMEHVFENTTAAAFLVQAIWTAVPRRQRP